MMKQFFTFLGLIIFSGTLWAQGGTSCTGATEAAADTNLAVHVGYADQWFYYTATMDGLVTISSCNLTDQDTYVGIYESCEGNEIYYNDDGCDDQSRISFDVVSGDTYYINWEGDWIGTDTVKWVLNEREIRPGESFGNPMVALEGTNYANHWDGASNSYWLYRATEAGYLEITTCGLTREDTYLEIYDASDTSWVTEIDDWCDLQSKTILKVEAGDSYFIVWTNEYIDGPATYPFEISFSQTPPRAGTDCINPIAVNAGNVTTTFDENYFVFHEYAATMDGKVMIYPQNTIDEYIDVAVLDGCDYDSDYPTYYSGDTIYFYVTEGIAYTIALVYEDFTGTTFSVDWVLDIRDEDLETIPGKSCMSALDASLGINTTDNSSGSIWYSYTSPEAGFLEISSCGFTDEDTYLFVYDDCNNTLNESSDDGCGRQSTVSFDVGAGSTSYIMWSDNYTSGTFDWEIIFSTGTEFLDFLVDKQTNISIDEANNTITIDVGHSADVTFLGQYFKVIEDATVTTGGSEVYPGDYLDFTDPVTYTITDPEGENSEDWTVTVNKNASLLSGNDIVAFSMDHETAPATINDTTVTIELEWGLTGCQEVTFELSDLAYMEDMGMVYSSGEYMCFELGDNVVDVVAEDGSIQEWVIKISETAAPSGSTCETAIAATEGNNTIVNAGSSSQWFSFTPENDGLLTIEFMNGDSWMDLYATCGDATSYQDDYSENDHPAHFMVSGGTTYHLRFEDYYSQYMFELSVEPLLSDNDFEWFGFDEAEIISKNLDKINHTVEITLAYDEELSTLWPEFDLSNGATAYIGGVEQDTWGEMVDFTSPVTYSIEAMDGTKQDWVVTVSLQTTPEENDLIYFTMLEALAPASINNNEKTATIWVESGTDLTAVVPYFSVSTEASAYTASDDLIVSSVSTIDLSSDFTMKVVAPDGSTANWTITVNSSDGTSGTDIVAYSLPNQVGSANIDNAAHTINVVVESGTDLTALNSAFTLSPNATATVGTTGQVSGVTINDFTSDVVYTVKAQDNTTQDWTVSVTIAAAVQVSSITVTGGGGANTISIDDGTLQMYAEVLPENASDLSITWSVNNGTGMASITQSGLLTAIENGTVTVIATANDGSGVTGEKVITISGQTGQAVMVSAITVAGSGSATSITTDGGTLQMHAAIAPENASDKTVTWSVVNGTGEATIDQNGVLTAVANGTVTVVATANDGSGVTGELEVTISGQEVGITTSELIEVSIYPNPASEVLYISIDNKMETYSYSLIDFTGKVVLAKENIDPASKENIELRNLAKGIYFLKLNFSDNTLVRKIIKE